MAKSNRDIGELHRGFQIKAQQSKDFLAFEKVFQCVPKKPTEP